MNDPLDQGQSGRAVSPQQLLDGILAREGLFLLEVPTAASKSGPGSSSRQALTLGDLLQ